MPFHLNPETINRAGRKKGTKIKRTIEVELAQKSLQQAILKNITPLTVAAINAAIGERFVYRIEKDEKGRMLKPEIVTDGREIANALEAIENDNSVVDDTYYYISTKPMNTHALQQLLDRAFGKPKESIDHNHKGEISLSFLLQQALERGKTKTDLPTQGSRLIDV